ncbi:MAG: hypothetical protein NT165_01615 [Candidatus Falkowbacteria bacterium]|nr:hypothetical protein [Candidatus Falkowbacteria bacterium]
MPSSIQEYFKSSDNKKSTVVSGQSIWTRPIYIHVMPQLRRKVSRKTIWLTIGVWLVVLCLAAAYFFIK